MGCIGRQQAGTRWQPSGGQGRAGRGAHPGRQLAAAFALGSQGVAVNHHPLDFELAKEIKITLIWVGGHTGRECNSRDSGRVTECFKK